MSLLVLAIVLAVVLLFSQCSGNVEGFSTGFALQNAKHNLSHARVITQTKPLSRNNLLPVSHSRFNMREIAKQSILLENHLLHSKKRCKDCIRKYFLAIEAFAEECIGSDKEIRFGNSIQKLPDFIREIQRQWSSGVDYSIVAQKIRTMRKLLSKYSFDSSN